MKNKPPGRWKPGESGNPSGRPKIPQEVKDLARAHTVEAINTLAEVMRNSDAPHSARVRASESLLERAWGKAESTVTVKTPNDVRELSRAEILAALAAQGIASEVGSAGESDKVH